MNLSLPFRQMTNNPLHLNFQTMANNMLFKFRSLPLLVTTIALVGCVSTPVSPLSRPSPEMQGEVIIFRESAFAAGGVSLKVGSGTSVFATLKNSEKVRAMFPAGEHEFFVQARSANPTKIRVTVEQMAPICLRTSANPSTYAKAAVPITLIVTGYHFYLDQVPCPSPDELAKYKDVSVTYQE